MKSSFPVWFHYLCVLRLGSKYPFSVDCNHSWKIHGPWSVPRPLYSFYFRDERRSSVDFGIISLCRPCLVPIPRTLLKLLLRCILYPEVFTFFQTSYHRIRFFRIRLSVSPHSFPPDKFLTVCHNDPVFSSMSPYTHINFLYFPR